MLASTGARIIDRWISGVSGGTGSWGAHSCSLERSSAPSWARSCSDGRHPVEGSPNIGIYDSDIYLTLAASLVGGWGLPLLFRGRPRRVLVILLAVETPLAILIAVGLAHSLPD